MIFSKRKKDTKKRIKRSAVISTFTVFIFLFTSIFSLGSTFAQQDVKQSNPIAEATASRQNYRIIVKLNDETAAKAEAQMGRKDMVIQKSSSKNMGDLFSRYKIKKMEPVYKDLINWKKKTGKSEKDYYGKIRKDFRKRSERSRNDVLTDTTNLSGTYVIEADVNSKAEYEKLLESLKKDSRFEYAEPDMILSASMVPNDPYFSSRGSWEQPFDDLYGVKITSCPEAWDTATGDGITVAVVDTGIDNTHPDISSNMWANTKEIANNGLDDDNNGFIDDTWGWNFAYGNNNPVDDHGHGTHVAGTIAATGNNGTGIVGVAPNARVMAVKGLNSKGQGSPETLANGIIYAAANGADIINCSFGGLGYSQALEDAVTEATNLGVVVVVAAGNEDDDANEYSPACVESAITVAATDNQDNKAYFSNWGSCIDVAAPGVDILSLRAAGTTLGNIVGDKYVMCSGTSMAAPHVAGVAALILSNHTELTNDQISSALKSSADDIMTGGFDYYSGYGRVNAGKALQINSSIQSQIDSPVQGRTIKSNIEITGSAKGSGFSSYTLEYGKIIEYGQDPVEWSTIAQGNTPVDSGKFGDFDISKLTDGKYAIRLSVNDNAYPPKQFIDRVEIEVDQIGFTNPAEAPDPSYATGIKPGKVITLQGSAAGQTFRDYRIEWGEGLNPTEWHTTGITLKNGGNTPVSVGALAEWDTGVYPERAGYYLLRLLVENDGYINEDRTIVYLDPDLASENWPQKLESPFADNSCVLPSGNFTGQSSLVGISSLQYEQTSFVRYSHDGVLKYRLPFSNVADSQVAVGDIDDFPGEETVFVKDDMMRILKSDNTYTEFPLNRQCDFRKTPVVLQDLDGDSVPEILALGVNRSNVTRYLYAYKLDGSLFSSKFPLTAPDISRNFESSMYVNFLVLDINNDGENEIITQQTDTNYTTTLNLYKWDGTPLAWKTQQPAFSNAYIRNMTGGDLDHDGQGEIVLWAGGLTPGAIQRLYVINSDGSVKSGWPYTVESAEIDIAIADMNRDGTDEIVYSQINEINVLKIDGKPMSGAWPDIRNRYYGKFSIGDINNDGYPEIVSYHMGEKIYTSFDSNKRKYVEDEIIAIDRNAQVLRSWKISGPGGAKPDRSLVYSDYLSSDPILGDFDSNGKVDIAVSQKLWDENDVLVDGALTVLSSDGDYSPDNMDWPVRLRNPQNTSVNIPAKPLPAVTAVTLNTTSASAAAGQKIRLSANVMPAGANRNIVWSVSDESTAGVAAVAQDGTVTAKLPGTAVIRAASQADPEKYAECTVTVTEALSGVLLKEDFESSSGSIIDGWSIQNVSGDKGEWSVVSNGTNPDVDTPKSGEKMAKFYSNSLEITRTRLYRTEAINLEEGGYCLDFWMYHDMTNDGGSDNRGIQVQATTDGGAHWIDIGSAIKSYDSSNGWKEHIISLDEFNGASDFQIAFVGTNNYGKNIYIDDISVFKSVPVSEVIMDKTFMNLQPYKLVQLTAKVMPENATDKTLIWTVQSQSENNVVILSKDGLVNTQYRGTAVVRATSAWDPGKYAECTIAINSTVVPVTGISLNKDSLALDVGQTGQLAATVSPSNATNSNVIWTVQSANGAVKISPSGLITAVNEGTAVVRAASTFDPGIYSECLVMVNTDMIPVTGVSLNKAAAGLEVGNTEQLTATVAPANATNKNVVWSVQGTGSAVTVSPDGLVTAVSEGTAVVRAASAADAGKYAECTITVTPAVVPVTGISLNKTAAGLEVGKTEQLTATVVPANATYKNVVWTVQGTGSAVTVSPSGLLSAVSEGTAVVRATSAADASKYAECTITVTPAVVPVTGISLNKTAAGLEVGKTEQLTATVVPANATNKNVIWTVQGTGSAVTVSPSGLVTAVSEGSAVIRATSAADASKYAECTITVTPAVVTVTGVSLDKTSVIMARYKLEQLTATVEPVNAPNKAVVWTIQSQNASNVATVSSSGRVNSLNYGTAVIRATSVADPSKYAECTVKVNPPGDLVTGVSLNKTTVALTAGQSEQLTAAVAPTSALIKDVIWTVVSQSTGNVAAVSTTGLVTANNPGTAVIRAASVADPEIYAECTVTVNPPGAVTGISLDKTSVIMARYKLEQLTAAVEPANALNKAVIWTIQRLNASNVATVSKSGMVNSLNYGTAVIRVASAADPSKYAECTVKVNPPGDLVTGVSLNKTTVALTAGQSEQLTAAVAPTSALIKDVIWTVVSQSTDNVAAVSTTGLVTANNPGTAVIRAASVADPDIYTECTVTVKF